MIRYKTFGKFQTQLYDLDKSKNMEINLMGIFLDGFTRSKSERTRNVDYSNIDAMNHECS